MNSVTEVQSLCFGLVLHMQHIFANSVNFLVTWGLPLTIFHSTCIFCVYDMALYWPTLQFYECMYVSFVRWYNLISVITTPYYVVIIFHHQVWYHMISLRYACTGSSSIILIPYSYATFVPNFVSFTASTAKLTHREKPAYSLTHSHIQPIWCPGNQRFCFGISRQQHQHVLWK